MLSHQERKKKNHSVPWPLPSHEIKTVTPTTADGRLVFSLDVSSTPRISHIFPLPSTLPATMVRINDWHGYCTDWLDTGRPILFPSYYQSHFLYIWWTEKCEGKCYINLLSAVFHFQFLSISSIHRKSSDFPQPDILSRDEGPFWKGSSILSKFWYCNKFTWQYGATVVQHKEWWRAEKIWRHKAETNCTRMTGWCRSKWIFIEICFKPMLCLDQCIRNR